MFETPFYHRGIRNFAIAFGALFSQLKVQRHDKDNSVEQVVGVPIVYGPKEKVFVKLRQDATQNNHVYTILPIMSFEIVGYNYDNARKMNKSNLIRCYKDGMLTSVYTPVPYNLSMQLHVMTKGAEDGFAIIEQILPLFAPEYTITVDALPDMEIKQNIPIVLNGVSINDDYEGDFSVRRLVVHTFEFTAKMNMYGAVSEHGVILRTDTDLPTFAHHASEGDLATGLVTLDEWTEL